MHKALQSKFSIEKNLKLTTGANLRIGSMSEFSDVIFEVAAEDILVGDSIEFKKEFSESSEF